MPAAISVDLAAFGRSWRDWLIACTHEVTEVKKGLAAEMFMYMLHETPQYSGESVSNWAMAVGSPAYSFGTGEKERYRESGVRGLRTPHSKAAGGSAGGPNFHAMDHAIEGMRTALAGVSRVEDVIFITNATQWDGKGNKDVTDIIEGQPAWLRPENRAGYVPASAMSFVSEKYRAIDALGVRTLMGMAV